MPDVTCSKCKLKMEKASRQMESGMDTYICKSCGSKKNIPKQSEEKIKREEDFKKLDRDRAALDDIVPEDSEVEEKSRETTGETSESEEQTQLYNKNDKQKKDKVESPRTANKPDSSDERLKKKIASLTEEVEILSKEIKELQAKVEIKDLDSKNFSSAFEKFTKEFFEVLEDFKSSITSKTKTLESLLKDFKAKFK